ETWPVTPRHRSVAPARPPPERTLMLRLPDELHLRGVNAMMRKMRLVSFLASFLTSAALTAGCGGGGSYCDAVCDCNRCSDRDYDICLDDYGYEGDYADRRDC